MKLAIMQPYFFPYIGYWQLISAVDTFVIYDDVDFIKQGWVNRNNILGGNSKHRISLQLIGASSFKLINEIFVGHNSHKLLKTIAHTYKKAPYFEEVFPMIEYILKNEEKNLALFLLFSIQKVCNYLEIKTTLLVSSELRKNNDLRGQSKVLDICSLLRADQYINAIGGQELYQKKVFSQKNIGLSFIRCDSVEYQQFDVPFIPNLSIIDALMFNDKKDVKLCLTKFELI